MAKTITIAYDGKEYTLEYTRASIEKMEQRGFIASELAEKPMSTLPALFAGAFIANHPYVTKQTTDAIFADLPDKQAFIQKLAEMYAEPLEALMDEPKKNAAKNVTWGANW